MTSHPNRNWRRRMQQAADRWLQTTQARVLIDVPMDPARAQEGMTKRLRDAYFAGYQDGCGRTQAK